MALPERSPRRRVDEPKYHASPIGGEQKQNHPRPPASACAIVAVDQRQRIIAFNSAAEALTGLKAADLLNASWDALPDSLLAALQETLRNKTALLDKTIQLRDSIRTETTAQICTSITTDCQGQITAVVAALTDSPQLNRLEQKREQLDRLASIGTLSASMAHEIKNALVAVRTFLELLPPPEKQTELAQVAIGELTRINSIVSQMLRFAGPAKPTFATLHIHQVLDHTLRLVQHHVEDGKIQLRRDYQASPDTIKGDSYQLQQALLNLLFNALDAMESEGTLTINTCLSQPDPTPASRYAPSLTWLQIRIKDTGIGISPENLSRVFDPFFTTKPKGNGLGLAITRRIVKEHKGNISVESQLHQGSAFTLSLPLAVDQ